MYRNILVAYDGSPFSRAALVESSKWVERHGGRLIMVHAIPFDEQEFSLAPEQREERLNSGKALCSEKENSFLEQYCLDAEPVVCEGDPSQIIVDMAQKEKADLIAMGTYGRRGLTRLVTGSVTSEVIVNAPCDILVVKRPCSECTGQFLSILVPYDGSAFSKKTLDRVCTIAETDNAVVTVLYVIPRYEEMMEFFRTDTIQKGLAREAERILAEAEAIASVQGVTVRKELTDGSAGERIIEAAHRLEADLIAMGTHGWKGMNKAIMGSSTQRVIMDASTPVLVVK